MFQTIEQFKRFYLWTKAVGLSCVFQIFSLSSYSWSGFPSGWIPLCSCVCGRYENYFYIGPWWHTHTLRNASLDERGALFLLIQDLKTMCPFSFTEKTKENSRKKHLNSKWWDKTSPHAADCGDSSNIRKLSEEHPAGRRLLSAPLFHQKWTKSDFVLPPLHFSKPPGRERKSFGMERHEPPHQRGAPQSWRLKHHGEHETPPAGSSCL